MFSFAESMKKPNKSSKREFWYSRGHRQGNGRTISDRLIRKAIGQVAKSQLIESQFTEANSLHGQIH